MPKDSKKRKKHVSTKKDRNQWVIIAPDTSLECAVDGCPDPAFVKLRHPKTDKGAMFFFSSDGSSVHEVMQFKRPCGSWFINDTVQEDGSLEVVTPVDPVFLLLPYLKKSSQERNKFMTLDQIVYDEDYPQCVRLLQCTGISAVENISEVKGSGDMRAYRYDETKTLDWLRAKVEQTTACLEGTDIHVGSGAQSMTFVRSTKDQAATDEDYKRYAAGLVSDYLSPELSKQMFELLGIKELSAKMTTKTTTPVENGDEPPLKKARLSSGKSEPEEDYSMSFKTDDVKQEKKPGKMTAGQRALSKVNTKGMKSISSFFAKKQK
ncbi:ribonuclease H2 subunit B-like [Diadema setosum]|uniref:ribonuclease H2 subunit B-like n=1 Tax=Diadema setosum TaxID=31175 RepID=UPI003B3AAE6C